MKSQIIITQLTEKDTNLPCYDIELPRRKLDAHLCVQEDTNEWNLNVFDTRKSTKQRLVHFCDTILIPNSPRNGPDWTEVILTLNEL